MSNGEGSTRYARTRGKEEPKSRVDVVGEVERSRVRKTVEILNGMAEDEDDTPDSKVDPKGMRRVPAIRFAK
jgi:hypothetical protein